MNLGEIMDIGLLAEMIQAGYVKTQHHPSEPLFILNYTHACQYDQVWNEVTTQCRGLIVRGDCYYGNGLGLHEAHKRGARDLGEAVAPGGGMPYAEIVARPYRKFFNYGDEENVPPLDLDATVQVFDKLDGSLGILYPMSLWRDPIYSGKRCFAACVEQRTTGQCDCTRTTSIPEPGHAIATRGSFTSEQALRATEILRTKYAGWLHPEYGRPEAVTYLFEIVYPENRIVLDYAGQEDLILLGGVEPETGKVVSPLAMVWPGEMAEYFPQPTLADALAMQPRPNREGIVVRFPFKGDLMVKIKQDDYVELHRLITGLNERVVWEMLRDGKTVADICVPLPDEFHSWVEDVADALTTEAARILDEAMWQHAEIMAALNWRGGWTRKGYAEMAGYHDLTRPYLFMILDGKDPRKAIWRTLRPSADRKMVATTEDTA